MKVLDIEVFRNYFLVMFAPISDGTQQGALGCYEQRGDAEEIADIHKDRIISELTNGTVVTFNGNNFDLPLLMLALKGATCAELKKASDSIIQSNLKPWHFEELYGVRVPRSVDHIDLIEVAPLKASLKMYSGRIHAKKLQDLPVEHTATLTLAQMEEVRTYCVNDLGLTIGLYKALVPQIALREAMSAKYGIDLRSKSDAQVAEAVIVRSAEKLLGKKVENVDFTARKFMYDIPAFIKPVPGGPVAGVLELLRTEEFVVPESGKVDMPEKLKGLKVTIGGRAYKLGIGGLHSQESSCWHVADKDTMLLDRDVTSYYPAIILGQGLAPENMGGAFTKTFSDILAQRIAAKRAGDKITADGLKISVNGSFGKFGSRYSKLYAPKLLVQTTVTGQLALLMLIERFEEYLIPVVSANTDGVVVKCPRGRLPDYHMVVKTWEQETGYETEETRYSALYSRDVNNYVALKDDGSVKLKGQYARPALSKNPQNEVCIDAVIAYLQKGTPVEDTVAACRDVRKFVTIRQVNGGCVKNGRLIGKVVRWYYSIAAAGVLQYKVNGYSVPRTEGAEPLMELPEEFPADLDYDWYVAEARSMLSDLGVHLTV